MAVNLFSYKNARDVSLLIDIMYSFKSAVIPAAQINFGVSGTATGNHVLNLQSKTLNLRATIASIVSTLDRDQVAAAWTLTTGEDPVNARADLLAVRSACTSLVQHIRTNTASYIIAETNSDNEATMYAALTPVQRADILALVNAISAEINIDAPA